MVSRSTMSPWFSLPALVALLGAGAAGCYTFETAPGDAYIECSKDDSWCPEGFACNLAVERCVPVKDLDQEPARITLDGNSPRPQIGSVGTVFELSFLVDERLYADPTVKMILGDGEERLWRRVSGDKEAAQPRYRYSFEPTAEDRALFTGQTVSGTITIQTQDYFGNEGEKAVEDKITLDFERPGLASEILITPTLVPADRDVLVRFSVTEALGALPTMTLGEGRGTCALDAEGEGIAYLCTYASSGNEDQALSHDVRIAVADEVGNPNTFVASQTVRFDLDAPAISAPEVGTPMVKAGDAATVTFELNEFLPTAPRVELRHADDPSYTIPMTGGSPGELYFRYTYKVEQGIREGRYEIFALADESFQDRAGNPGAETFLGELEVDLTEPGFSAGPTLTGSTTIGPGGAVLVDFTVTEELAEVKARIDNPGGPLDLDCPPPIGLAYQCRYQATGSETELNSPIGVQLTDPAGNRSQLTNADYDVRFDFTPPGIGACQVSPGEARAEGEVIIGFSTSEPVPAPPAVLEAPDLPGAAPSLVFQNDPDRPTEFRYRYVVPDVGGSGSFDLFVTLEDAVSNQQRVMLPRPVAIDIEALAISDLAVIPPSHAGGEYLNRNDIGQDVVFSFTLGAADQDAPGEGFPAAWFGQQPMSCGPPDAGRYDCTARITGMEPDGVLVLTVDVEDPAGNFSSDSKSIEVDFTPPGLGFAAVAPTMARAGQDVTLSITATEPLGEPPEIEHELPVNPLEPTDPDPDPPAALHLFEYTAPANAGDADYSFQVTLTDTHGNEAGPFPLGVNLRLNTSVPNILAPQVNAVDFSEQPGFDLVEVTFDCSESVDDAEAKLQVRVGGEDMDCRPFQTVSPNYACTYGVTAAASHGRKRVEIATRDAAWNEDYNNDLEVRFDLESPEVEGSTLLRYPSYAYAGEGSLIRFSRHDPFTNEPVKAVIWIYADEPVMDGAALSVNELPAIDFGPGEVTGESVRFEYSMDQFAPPADGVYPYTFQITWSDAVGNEATRDIPGRMIEIDTQEPQDGFDLDATLYERTPWGSEATGGEPLFTVSGAMRMGLAGATTDVRHVIAYRAAEASPGNLIGAAVVDPADGSFIIPKMSGGDLPALYLAGIDAAGVRGATTDVKEVLWTATLGGKIPGSSFENPHQQLATARFDPSLGQDAELIEAPLPEAVPSLTGVDGDCWTTRGDGRWLRYYPSRARPDGRMWHAAAYDSMRGRVVLFGGYGDSMLGDTWEFDGFQWEQLNPIFAPLRGRRHAMAFDPVRGETVLFGGTGSIDETWVWDGVNWEQKFPEHVPPERRSHTMVFDPARGEAVLFGGINDSFEELDDTWVWDGTDWTEKAPAVRPWSRYDHAMAYDPVRERVVVFGGTDGASDCILGLDGRCDDTWEWNGDNWQEIAVDPLPPKLEKIAMAYDATLGGIVMFGGTAAISDETWFYDGADWTELTPATRPAARVSHSIVRDTVRERLVLFGGQDAGAVERDDTWLWDGVNWQPWDPDNVPNASAPMTAYDSRRNETLVFGGMIGGAPARETWAWNGTHWTRKADAGLDQVFGAMAYDVARDRVVSFGGTSDGSNPSSATLLWNGSSWSTAAAGPATRIYAAMAYDAARTNVVLFGGAQGLDTGTDTTWLWNGSSWSAAASAHRPPARVWHAMAYDATRQRVVLFGGSDRAQGPAVLYDDTWEWDGSDWAEIVPAHRPPARIVARSAFDAARGKVVLFGGFDADGEGLPAVWEWDGVDWARRDTRSEPPLSLGPMAYDALRGRAVVADGGGTWEWSGSSEGRAAQIVRYGFYFSGAHQEQPHELTATVVAGGSGQSSRFLLNAVPMQWAAARKACENLGGHLASISDGDEHAAVADFLGPDAGYVWIGLNDIDNEGAWEFVDGAPYGVAPWNTGEPNGGVSENCVHVISNVDHKWNDSACTSMMASLCEVDAVAGASGAGFDLHAWQESAWRPVATSDAAAGAPTAVSWTVDEMAAIENLFQGDGLVLHLAVVPSVPRGTTEGEIAVDYSELVLRYRRCPDADLGSVTGAAAAAGTTSAGVAHRESGCGGAAGERLLAWTAPADGQYSFDTAGTGFDTVLYVLDGCGGDEIACNDDDPAGGVVSSKIENLDLLAGETVVIVVDGNPGENGDFVLNIQ